MVADDIYIYMMIDMDRQIDRQIDRFIDKQMDGWIDMQTGRMIDRNRDGRRRYIYIYTRCNQNRMRISQLNMKE